MVAGAWARRSRLGQVPEAQKRTDWNQAWRRPSRSPGRSFRQNPVLFSQRATWASGGVVWLGQAQYCWADTRPIARSMCSWQVAGRAAVTRPQRGALGEGCRWGSRILPWTE